MTSRAQRITASIDRCSTNQPIRFWAGMVLGALGFLSGGTIAILALLAGPIGIALQMPFYDFSVSRLVALQMSASLAFLFGAALMIAYAPVRVWLKSVWALNILKKRPWIFWLSILSAALWVNIFLFVNLPFLPCIEPDTIGYLSPSPLRSSGYMVIIQSIVWLFGDLKWIVPIQLNVMLASFAALGWAIRSILKSQSAGIIMALLPTLSSGLIILAPTVMTEAFFVALLCFHLTAVLCVFRKLTAQNLMWVGVTLALMIIIRPNGISFLAGIPLLIFFYTERWRLVLTSTLSPILIVCIAQGFYHQQNFGFFGLHQFGGVSLVGVAAPLISADMATDHPKLAHDIEQNLKSYYVDFPPFAQRSFPFEMAHVSSLTAVGAIYYVILPTIRKSLDFAEPNIMVFEHQPRLNEISGSLAKSAIAHNPLGFLKIISSNYIANWHNSLPIRVPFATFYPRCLKLSQDVTSQYFAYFSNVTDVSQFQDQALLSDVAQAGASGIRALEWPRMIVGVFQKTLSYTALFLSLWGLWLIVKHRRAPSVSYRSLAYTALVLQSGYGLISIGNASFTRYTVTFDPLIILLLVIGAAIMGQYVFQDKDAEA